MTGLDFEGVKRANSLVSAAQSAGVRLLRAGREWKACCPFHPDKSPSFTIYDDDRKFRCFGCGAAGDVLDFVQRAKGVGLREAVDLLGGGGALSIAPHNTASVAMPREDRAGEALAIWSGAADAAGTPVARYLRSRGLVIPLPASIRFARLPYGNSGPSHPALVALVTDAHEKPMGIQRTYLDEGGAKAKFDKVKLSLGRVSGGAIRLGPVCEQVTVCEGLEDGLSLAQVGAGSVWVAAGASMLPAMQFPPAVRSVVIGADSDEAGEREALKAGAAYSARGLSVRIIRPLAGFKDFNAELQGAAA